MTKPTKWHVRPAKTQISLGIRPVWSESSLSAWRKLGPFATHWAHSEDWSDWADAQADLSHLWVRMPFCWFCHEAAHMSFWPLCEECLLKGRSFDQNRGVRQKTVDAPTCRVEIHVVPSVMVWLAGVPPCFPEIPGTWISLNIHEYSSSVPGYNSSTDLNWNYSS